MKDIGGKSNQLREIALELLERYRESEQFMIWEVCWGTNAEEAEKALAEEIKTYRKRIELAE